MVVGFLTERSDGCTGTVSTLATPYSQNESDNATHYKKVTHTCDTDSPTTRCVIEGSLDAYTENTHAGPKEREAKPESTEGRRVGGLLKKQKGAPLNLG